jgi:nucleoid-associated protein YgaU
MARAMHRAGILGAMMVALAVAACVPEPAWRQSAGPDGTEAVALASSTPVATAGPTPVHSFVRPTPTPGPSFASYTVRKGDTLSKIAKRFKTTGQSIAYWNRVTYPSLDPESTKYRPDRLEVGWVLVVLPNQQVDPEALPTLSPRPTPTPRPTPAASATPAY